MTPIPLWVEPCAGSLAVGLRLLGLPRLVGWMGGKGGYADAILHELGLSPEQGAREVWLADVSDWAVCWEALAQPGVAHEAAQIIEEWAVDAGPRRMWEILRAQPTTPDAWGVARWLVLIATSHPVRFPGHSCAWRPDGTRAGNAKGFDYIAARLRMFPPGGLPLRVWRDARAIPPAPGVVLLDPPYDGTAGYGFGDLPRSEVLALADRWTAAGATVAICEHDPIPGWHAVDLIAAGARSLGSRMTRRTSEWLSVRGVEPRRPVAQLGLL